MNAAIAAAAAAVKASESISPPEVNTPNVSSSNGCTNVKYVKLNNGYRAIPPSSQISTTAATLFTNTDSLFAASGLNSLRTRIPADNTNSINNNLNEVFYLIIFNK